MMTDREIQLALSRRPTRLLRGEAGLGSIYGQEEMDAMEKAMREAMDVTVGFGFSAPPIPEFEEAFARYLGTGYAIAVNSCGPGLDIVMRFLDLKPGDEVIVPSINYQAAPLAVMGAGGTVVWGECDEETFMLHPEDVERKITPRTRAIFPVHIHGCSAPIDDYIEIASRHPHPVYGPPKVVEDCARSCGADYKGGKAGSRSWASVFSFHTAKNMTTLGEGGMIATNDRALSEYAHSVRMYGNGVNAWGTSNVMTKVQAAVGLVQLARLDSFIAARRQLAHARNRMLEGLDGLGLPYSPADSESSFYLYAVRLPVKLGGEGRDSIIARLKEEFGVEGIVANKPVYLTRNILAERFGRSTPFSEKLAGRMLCLGLHPAMQDWENEYIAAALVRCLLDAGL